MKCLQYPIYPAAAWTSHIDMSGMPWFCLFFLTVLLCTQGMGASGPDVMDECANGTEIIVSGVYSPYTVHLIRSEVSGTIAKINAREGQILRAGTPIMELDISALQAQKIQLRNILRELKAAEKVLSKNRDLAEKKYERYAKLKQQGHIEAQAVENVERELHAAELSLIDNRRQQSEVRRSIIDIDDRIKKACPSFSKDLYVAQNFKELFESVVPGENLSRLLDTSAAKIHLVLPPSCFKEMKERLTEKQGVDFDILTEKGLTFGCRGRVERLKIDPDNSYLYSYGFDLVFPPVRQLLWGQVVRVRLQVDRPLPGDQTE